MQICRHTGFGLPYPIEKHFVYKSVSAVKEMVLHERAPIESSPLRLEDVPEPLPGLGEVSIRVKACGVCRTDLHVIEGELPPAKTPIIPGHEVVGIVHKPGRLIKCCNTGVHTLFIGKLIHESVVPAEHL